MPCIIHGRVYNVETRWLVGRATIRGDSQPVQLLRAKGSVVIIGLRINNRFQTALVAYGDVSFIEQLNRKIVVHTSSGEYWEYCSMEAMLNRADGRMYRCHHSLAVNMDAIVSVSRNTVELADGHVLSMCHAALGRTKKAWIDYIS
jgi:DNA-binding LytR/AlgR family response regulator